MQESCFAKDMDAVIYRLQHLPSGERNYRADFIIYHKLKAMVKSTGLLPVEKEY